MRAHRIKSLSSRRDPGCSNNAVAALNVSEGGHVLAHLQKISHWGVATLAGVMALLALAAATIFRG